MKTRRLIFALYRSRVQGQICLEVLLVHYLHLDDAKHQTEAHINVCQLPSHLFPWWWQCCACMSSIVSWSKTANCILHLLCQNLCYCPSSCRHCTYRSGSKEYYHYWNRVQWSVCCTWSKMCQARTHPMEPTSTLATTNPPHLAACRPSSLKCSSHPYNKDNSIDFFYKVVEGLVPAMSPVHFLTQQRPWRLVCSCPIGSSFSPSRLKM